MTPYDHNTIEKRWQNYWATKKSFEAITDSDLPKFYALDMFPYPSGAGLHVGHPLGYIASDIVSRYKRHKGFNVLHPMGYDSFGLPAEQYAIQTGQHPAITTQENIARYREQLDRLGFSFDWEREVRTSDPAYYKWTQHIFIQLFNAWYDNDADEARSIEELEERFRESGNATVNAVSDEETPAFTAEQWNSMDATEQQKLLLNYRMTYLADTEVNWCPALGTVLANDEVVNGVSERGGHPVMRKKMRQWMMRISAYADRLLTDLEPLDWSDAIKEIQRNWIGKSIGAMVRFQIENQEDTIEVFTTRPDTIYGVTFLTLAPEHPLVQKITTADQQQAINDYIELSSQRSERERMADVKTISGVFTGAYATHPLSGEQVPIWIGDYVLAGYGTGAVMAVPCGDSRDHAFANHFKGVQGMPEIINIFDGIDITEEAHAEKDATPLKNSQFLNGSSYQDGSMKMAIDKLEELDAGLGKTNFRLRDAVFSRQRYWGEPFPVYYKDGLPYMIEEKFLPIVLPEVDEYLPTEDGAPPLGRAQDWHWCTRTNCVVSKGNKEEGVYPLELNTMPGWAGSSWYLYRYMDAQNSESLFAREAQAYWRNVDLYIGGSEHATGHLLYSRFWTKFLYDMGELSIHEPFKKMINQGMILGESAFIARDENGVFVSESLATDEMARIHVDVSMVSMSNELDLERFKGWRADYADAQFITENNGTVIVSREVEKMSKSKYNVVNPDDICEEYGADTLRLYEMFLGPLEQAKPWNTAGITGVYGF